MLVDKKLIEDLQLDQEELELLEEQDKNEWVSTKNLKSLQHDAQVIAKNTIKNMKKITLNKKPI